MANARSSNNEWRIQSAIVAKQNIRKIRDLGSGSQGNVELAIVPFFGVCAVKYLIKCEKFVAEREKQNARELVAAQELAHHPNIVDFYGKVEDVDNNITSTVGFFTEFMEGGNLIDVMIDRISEDVTSYFKMGARWAIQIARALAFCHSQKVIHRDIKPENMLLSEDYKTIKICDFGLSRPDTDTSRNRTCNQGTSLYMAPEVMSERGDSLRYGTPIDVYSFGMFLYGVFHRQHPFQYTPYFEMAQTNIFQFQRELRNGIRPENNPYLPDEIDNIIKKCWQTDPSNRPSMNEVVTHLENYWNRVYPGEVF